MVRRQVSSGQLRYEESGPASRERIIQSCYLLPLPPGRQLVFFKTGWSHVVPDPSKTTYVRASG